MSPTAPSISAALIGVCLCCYGVTTLAADSTTKPRYAIPESRLQATPERTSVDGRFRLESRLQPGEQRGESPGGITVRAKLVDATAAACDAGTIFANSFE